MDPSIGILGCGTIGTEIATAIKDDTVEGPLAALYDRNHERAVGIAETFPDANQPTVAEDVGSLTAAADLVVETAGQSAVSEWAVPILEDGTDLMPLSVGALADADLREQVVETAERTGATVHVPSGAIAGLDAIRAAALTSDLERVSLRTRKNPAGLAGAPYIENNDVSLDDLTEETVVFEGPATEAAAAFPSNINVAVALSLAGTGAEETTVTIVADPDEDNNVHHIEASGGMGRIETEVHNVPSPTNPKTSYLAAISAIEKLRGLSATLRIGT